MKFNLKNRPKKWIQWTGDKRDIHNEVKLPQNVEEWFKEFEKELRQMLKGFESTRRIQRIKFPTSERQVVEEVLGE